MSFDTSPAIIPAEEVCEYTFKFELIEKDKLLLVVFNTTTGIKYQTYIEEYSDTWESIKINFQHNFHLCFKMLTKALIEKDPSFTVNVLHKIDYVNLQLSYINDLLGFTIELNVNQYKKDNLQESFNIMEYKQKLLEDENKSLKTEVKNIHQELTELKRIINLLGDSLSYDNKIRNDDAMVFHTSENPDINNVMVRHSSDPKIMFSECYESNCGIAGSGSDNYFILPFSVPMGGGHGIFNDLKYSPLLTKSVVNKMIPKVFEDIIKKHKLNYDISKEGYNWNILKNMCKARGLQQEEWTRCIPRYIMNNYGHDWKSFKELYDITI
jgi:hypothetical protein